MTSNDFNDEAYEDDGLVCDCPDDRSERARKDPSVMAKRMRARLPSRVASIGRLRRQRDYRRG